MSGFFSLVGNVITTYVLWKVVTLPPSASIQNLLIMSLIAADSSTVCNTVQYDVFNVYRFGYKFAIE